MKGKFEYTKREGLPGGANEMQQFAKGVFSIEGYKRFSPDVNNSFNIIPSGDITMKDVDFPVHGVDNLGNSQIMYPGNDYKFPGSSVFETPLRNSDDYEEAELTEEEIADLRAQGYVVEEYQDGGQSDKSVTYTYSGRPGVRYQKGPFGWTINIPGQTNGYVPIKDPTGKRAAELDKNAIPAQEEDYIKYNAQKAEESRNALQASNNTTLLDMFSIPQNMMMSALTDNEHLTPSSYLQSKGINNPVTNVIADVLVDPVNVTGVLGATGKLKNVGEVTSDLKRVIDNAYKYNPGRFKTKPGYIYRQVGKPGYDNAINTKRIWDKGQEELLAANPDLNYVDEYNKMINETGLSITKPSPAPFFSKDELFFPLNRKATGKGNKKTKFSDAEYLFERKFSDDHFLPRYRDSYLKEAIPGVTETGVITPDYNMLDDFNVYKRNWWKGYKPISPTKSRFHYQTGREVKKTGNFNFDPKGYAYGGEYDELELTDKEIEKYKAQGYVVEEVDEFQPGGPVNTLEGDLFAKVLMERNRDKEFVKRAFNPQDYPNHVQYNEDGTTSTHRMAWGTDDTGQAYMFPTIFNEANEAIPVPNQYADYISSQGYKRATGMDKYQKGAEVKHKWDNPVLQRALKDSAKVAASPYLQKILKQKQEWEAANAPADTVETSPTPKIKMMPDNFEQKSDNVGKYNNPDLYAQPEPPTSELDKAITNRDVKSYSDILNPFKNPYMQEMLPDEEYYEQDTTKQDTPKTLPKSQNNLDGSFDGFEIVDPVNPQKEKTVKDTVDSYFEDEENEFQFVPFSVPNYGYSDETYNDFTKQYYEQNEKADAKMQELYYIITNPSVSQEEKDSAQKQFDDLKELQKLNVSEINRIKKRQAGAFDVLLQEEGPSWLSKGLQKIGFADDYSLDAPPGEKLYEDYQTKATRDYEKELVTKSYESLNTPGEAGQWYRWKYRVNASNDDPVTVQLYGNRGERDKKDPNIKGLGAMMHFLDQSPLTGSSHSSMRNFYKRLSDDQYIGYLQKGDGENYQLMYKKVGEIPKDELTSQNTFYLRTEDFDNINFDGKRVVDNNFAGHTYWTRKNDGKATIPISIGHNNNDYNYSSGNAVVYIFNHNGKTRYIHFAGSPNAIRKEGERIKKDYKLKDNALTIGIADAGSYASAVKADKQGKVNNKLLNSKDYGYWNLNSFTGAGMVLQNDFKSGGEYTETELTPEEINWYRSQGYQIDELE